MCTNKKCEWRKACYRAQAKPSERQSWFEFGEFNCWYFIPIDNKKITGMKNEHSF